MQIRPFRVLRPRPDVAGMVASVPYDVVDAAEAAALAAGNPLSFLRVSRSEIDLPPGTDPYSPAVYEKAAENLRRLRDDGVLCQDREPGLFVYRQIMGNHAQRGVVACCSAEEYERDIIRKHEKTRKDKEDDRTRHIQAIHAQPGPVFVAYRNRDDIDRLVAAVERSAPLYDFTAPDGIRHTVWRVGDPKPVLTGFEKVPLAYIADGHHRAAAAVRVARERRAANPGHTGREEYNWFMAALFPANQLQILPCNRAVRDLNGMSPAQFMEAVAARFTVRENAANRPAAPANISMYLPGAWHGLSWKTDPAASAVDALDVSVLQNRLLGPLLGIDDPRTTKRIDFIGGIRGPGELVKLVDSGRAAVAFSMFPTTTAQLMAVSDAGQIMPPKSTWFEPKLRSGLLIHTL